LIRTSRYRETISACLVHLSEERRDPEHRVDENVRGAQLGSRFQDWHDNRMQDENERRE
jgi:hypothetical protein